MRYNLCSVVLAAGSSSRMGTQKLLLPLQGAPILQHVLKTVTDFQWAQTIVVASQQDDETMQSLCDAYSLKITYNNTLPPKKSASIQAAIAAINVPNIDGILFVQGDQPFISVALLKSLLTRFYSDGPIERHQRIILPCYEGELYAPVIFGIDWRDQLFSLSGDAGGKAIIQQNSEFVASVPWSDLKSLQDIDTTEDYRRWCKP